MSYEFTDVVFDFQSNKLDQNEAVELKAEVEYAYDLNEDDNVVSTNVKYLTSEKLEARERRGRPHRGGREPHMDACQHGHRDQD